MSVACVLFEGFRVQVERQRNSQLGGRPTIVFDPRRQVVVDALPSRVAPGTRLQEAVSQLSQPVLIEANEAAYQALFDGVLDVLEAVSPEVEPVSIGTAYVNLVGLDALYGGMKGTVQRLEAAIPPKFEAQIGVATNKFLALIAARAAHPGAPRIGLEEDTFFQDVSVDTLPISHETIARLRDFGLRTLGDIARHPVGPIQAQFGGEGRLAWELARGIDRRPFTPRRHQEVINQRLEFPLPVVERVALVMGLETLLQKAFACLAGRSARKATLTVCLYPNRGIVSKTVSFREATSQFPQALFVLKSTIQRLEISGPVDEMALQLAGLGGDTGKQGSLWSDVRARENLGESLRQLEARLGKRPPIYRVKDVEPWSRLPERRQALVSFNP